MSLSRRSFLKVSSLAGVGVALSPIRIFPQLATKRLPIQRAAFTMGSIVTILAYHPDQRLCNFAIDESFAEMKAIDRIMSIFDEKSELSGINRSAGRHEIVVDGRIIEVISSARRFYEWTGGAFDVTIEPLMNLYGFRDDSGGHPFPTDREIARTMEGVGMHHLVIDHRQSTIASNHHSTRIDLGGIAVGYALDRAGAILRQHGIDSALINHSGDILAIGTPPDASAWSIGIKDPQHPESIIATLQIKDEALSTSGNYENFVRCDTETIGHLFNPRTGRAATAMLSGTAIAPRAIEADALSTGLFVMGLDQSAQLLAAPTRGRFVVIMQEGITRLG